MSFALAMLLRPFVLLAILGSLLCVRYAIIWWFPEGKVKRLLLYRVSEERKRHSNGWPARKE